MARLVMLMHVLFVAALFGIAGSAAAQQDFPARPVRLLIPFPPGTGNDVVGRIVGNKLSEILDQRVVADNRAGASGNIAIGLAHRAAPDGYTLVVASTSFSINQYTMKDGYPLSGFTPVALIGMLPYTLIAAKSVPAAGIKELVALLKANRGQYTAGSGGPTGTSFFLLEAFKKAAGVQIQMVAYKGTTAGVVDLLGGRIQLLFAPMVTSLPHYHAGKIQLLGVTGSARSTLMPEVPTFTESGYPMLDIQTWFAFLGPAGLPDEVVKVLSDGVQIALASKDVIDALSRQGVEPGFATPAQTRAFLEADSAQWGKRVEAAGIRPR